MDEVCKFLVSLGDSETYPEEHSALLPESYEELKTLKIGNGTKTLVSLKGCREEFTILNVSHVAQLVKFNEPHEEGAERTKEIKFNITKHEVKSATEKPFMCTICGFTFGLLESLGSHVLDEHGPLNCASLAELEKNGGKVLAPSTFGPTAPTKAKVGRKKGKRATKGCLLGKKLQDEFWFYDEEEGGGVDEKLVKTYEGSVLAGSKRKGSVNKNVIDDRGENVGRKCDSNSVEGEVRKGRFVNGGKKETANSEDNKSIRRSLRARKGSKKCPEKVKTTQTSPKVKLLKKVEKASYIGPVQKFPCDFCDLLFDASLTRGYHHHSEHSTEQYVCNVCSKTFPLSKRGIYRNHISTRHNVESAKTECSECGRKFVWKMALQAHVKANHPDKFITKAVCDTCGGRYASEASLREHIKLVHTLQRHFSCEICGKTFKTKEYLEVHTRCHSGEKPYKCSYCDARFTQRAGKIAHEKHHTKDKPFACSVCSKRFISRQHVKMHSMVHTGARPFSCTECGSAFKSASALRMHKKLHEGVKPFECKMCGHTFAHKCNLVDHERTHTGEKPFQCTECEMSFGRHNILKQHLAKHHDIHLPDQRGLTERYQKVSAVQSYPSVEVAPKYPQDPTTAAAFQVHQEYEVVEAVLQQNVQNFITIQSVDGLPVQGVDGLPIQGVDGSLVQGVDGSLVQGVDGSLVQGVDGLLIQGVDGSEEVVEECQVIFDIDPNEVATKIAIDSIS